MNKVGFLLACLASGSHGRRLQNLATKSQKPPIERDSVPSSQLFVEVNRSDSQANVRGLATLLLNCNPMEAAFMSSVWSISQPAPSNSHPLKRVDKPSCHGCLPVMTAADLDEMTPDEVETLPEEFGTGADDDIDLDDPLEDLNMLSEELGPDMEDDTDDDEEEEPSDLDKMSTGDLEKLAGPLTDDDAPDWWKEALEEAEADDDMPDWMAGTLKDTLKEEKGRGSKKKTDVQGERFRVQGDLLTNKNVCAGCGCGFHSESPDVPGYLPADVFARLGARKHDASLEVLDLAALESGEGDLDDEDLDLEGLDLAEDVNQHQDMDALNSIEMDEVRAREEWAAAKRKKKEECVTFCQRCFRLRQYGEMDDEMRPGWSRDEALLPSHFKKIINTIGNKRCVIITLVDVFDFHGSILPNIRELAGDNPVIVAVNKADLLPDSMFEPKLRSWIRHECASFVGLKDLPGPAIHLVSAKTGMNVDKLLDTAKQLAKERKCDIYVVGAANVGKSSLLNRICNAEGGQSNKGRNSKKHFQKPGITISSVPGTTLSFLKVAIGNGVRLFDTPGLILPHQLTVQLNNEELKQVVPQKQVKHKTVRMGAGKAVLLGGLARIEIEEGLPFFLTIWVAEGVKIQPTDAGKRDLDEYVRNHVGDLLTPPMEPERLLDLGELESHQFTIEGAGWQDAACDIVLSGLGWVSFTGSGRLSFKVSVPRGVMVLKREPLMPNEAMRTSMKYTGGHLVGGFVKKKRDYGRKDKKSTLAKQGGGGQRAGAFGNRKPLGRKFGARARPAYH
mmetsp:Transcript_128635/g.222963  ORF Transcript_128635/g.222963 Transcript_128635/m.222963 type:complete len:788 (+) Transcript_128635:6-2369(+)